MQIYCFLLNVDVHMKLENAELISCHLVSFFQGVSLTVSIETLVCISIDRFVAVVFPLKAHDFHLVHRGVSKLF